MGHSKATPRIFSLNLYANYACGHSGACCNSRWPIPVELRSYDRLRESIEAGRLELPIEPRRRARVPPDEAPPDEPFVSPPGAPRDTPVVTALDRDGACAFYDRDRHRCSIHRQLGPALLPVACQQFPRVSLVDGRGLFVIVSHYCPTAANLLFVDVAPAIVENPPAFPPSFTYDPLDARNTLPPLLHPGVMLDLESYDAWERAAVAQFGRCGSTAEQALTRVAVITETVRGWKPGSEPFGDRLRAAVENVDGELARPALAAHVREASKTGALIGVLTEPAGTADVRRVRLALAAIPPELRPALAVERAGAAFERWVAPEWSRFSGPMRGYLASKAFGSWLAYQGRGLRTTVFSLAVALSLVRVFAALGCNDCGRPLDRAAFGGAVRRADEVLLHLASWEDLARSLSRVEQSGFGA